MQNIPALFQTLLELQKAAAKWLYTTTEGKPEEAKAHAAELVAAHRSLTMNWPTAPQEVPLFGDLSRHVRFGQNVDMMNIIADEIPAALKWCVDTMEAERLAQRVSVDQALESARAYASEESNRQFTMDELVKVNAAIAELKETLVRGVNELQGGQEGIQEKLKVIDHRMQALQQSARADTVQKFGHMMLGVAAELVMTAIIPSPGALIAFRA